MSSSTRDEARFIQKFIIFVIIPLILFGFVRVRVMGKIEDMEEMINVLDTRVSRYVRKKGGLPSLKKLMKMKAEAKQVESDYEQLLNMSVVRPVMPPEDVIEKGVYFKKKLYMTEKKLFTKAEQSSIKMPDNIGFGEALPSEKDVPLLLRKLEMVDSLLSELLKFNPDSINLVKILDDRKFYTAENNDLPFTEIAVRVDAEATLKASINFLDAVRSIEPMLSVRDFNMKVLKDGLFEISFVFSRIIVEG